MTTEKLDVKKEIIALDHKLLDLLVKRFELNSYIADAKYSLNGENSSITIKDEKKRQDLLNFFKKSALKKAKEKNFINSEEFANLASEIADEILLSSWDAQKKYLKQKYNVNCN